MDFKPWLSFLTDEWLNNELWNNGLCKSPQLLILSFRNVFPKTIQCWPNRIIVLRHCLSQDLRSQFQKKNYLEMFNFLSTITILSVCRTCVRDWATDERSFAIIVYCFTRNSPNSKPAFKKCLKEKSLKNLKKSKKPNDRTIQKKVESRSI